jgi:hypothetical protein
MKNALQIAQINAVVAFGLPWVIAVLKQNKLSKRANSLIAAGACCIAAFCTVAAQGDMSLLTWGASAVQIFTIAGASYKNLWQFVGEPAVERATSLPALRYSKKEFAAKMAVKEGRHAA